MNDGRTNRGASSSSSQSPPQPHYDGNDEPRRPGTADSDLFGADATSEGLAEPLSFKRKQKGRGAFGLGLLTSLTGARPDSSNTRTAGDVEPRVSENIHTSNRMAGSADNTVPISKVGAPLDWYVEGPGRRVGYEDLTAIDWIFEYTKERTRLRVLSSSGSGLLGHAKRLLDASQEWIILALTGILVGVLAAVIDITTDWLGDLKGGYCSTANGGAFYLNKHFCCLGYDDDAQCMGWRPWAAALHISSSGGKWAIEYVFFIIFSVWSLFAHPRTPSSYEYSLMRSRWSLLFAPSSWYRSIRFMRDTAVYPRSRLYWEVLSSRISLECGR